MDGERIQLDGGQPTSGNNSRRKMVRAELLGQHTHQTCNKVAVNIWRRGDSYMARGRCDGAAFGETLGKNEQDAAGCLRRIMVEMDDGTFVRASERCKRPLSRCKVPRQSVRQLCDNFLANKRQTVGRDTSNSYQHRLAPLIEFAEDPVRMKKWQCSTDMDGQFAAEFKSFLGQRKVTSNGRSASAEKLISPRQIYNILDCARTCVHWAVKPENNQLPSWFVNPFTEEIVGSRPNKDLLRDVVFSIETRMELIKVMDLWQLSHLAIPLIHALRPEDVTGLLIEEVDFELCRLMFGTRFGGNDFNKEHQEFTVPFSPQIAPLLQACVGERTAGPLLRKRTVFDDRRKPKLVIASPIDVSEQVQKALLEAPQELVQTSQDRKKIVRQTIRDMGGVSEDSLAKEFKKVLASAGMPGAGRFYDLRGSAHTDLQDARVTHDLQLYLTGHSLDISKEYVTLRNSLMPEMNRLFEHIEPLVTAMLTRARELGVRC